MLYMLTCSYEFHYGIWCWSQLALEWTPIFTSQSIVLSLYSIVGVGVTEPPPSTNWSGWVLQAISSVMCDLAWLSHGIFHAPMVFVPNLVPVYWWHLAKVFWLLYVSAVVYLRGLYHHIVLTHSQNPGSGPPHSYMQLLTVQSRKMGDAGKLGGMVTGGKKEYQRAKHLAKHVRLDLHSHLPPTAPPPDLPGVPSECLGTRS